MTKPDTIDRRPADPGHLRPVLVAFLLCLPAFLIAALAGRYGP